MPFQRLLPALFFLTITGHPVAAADTHRCAPEAIAQAKKLLRFHADGAVEGNTVNDGMTVQVLPQVKALTGTGTFDVLEVSSDIYKARYRMRFIYARTSGQCLLMGQEILEASNPY